MAPGVERCHAGRELAVDLARNEAETLNGLLGQLDRRVGRDAVMSSAVVLSHQRWRALRRRLSRCASSTDFDARFVLGGRRAARRKATWS